MLLTPLRPRRANEGIKLEARSLEWSRDRFSGGLLPAAAGLAVLVDFIRSDHAFVVEVQAASADLGAINDAGTAHSAPGHRDRPIWHLVMHAAVLCDVCRGIGFG